MPMHIIICTSLADAYMVDVSPYADANYILVIDSNNADAYITVLNLARCIYL